MIQNLETGTAMLIMTHSAANVLVAGWVIRSPLVDTIVSLVRVLSFIRLPYCSPIRILMENNNHSNNVDNYDTQILFLVS
jgi:hypothetical protein